MRTNPCIGVDRLRVTVERIPDRRRKHLVGFFQPPVPAHKLPIVIQCQRVLAIKVIRLAVMFFGQLILTESLVQNSQGSVCNLQVGILLQRFLEFLHRGLVHTFAHVLDSQLGIDFSRVPLLLFRKPAFVRRTGTEQQYCCHQPYDNFTSHQINSPFVAATRRSRRRVRSLKSPASCPQAASISSPRVLRVIVTMPAWCRMSRKRSIRSALLLR